MKIYFVLLIVFLGCKSKVQKEFDVKDNVKFAFNDEDSINRTITDFVYFFNKKDEENLNNLIDPTVGVFLLYRRGTVDEYKWFMWISLKKESKIKMDIPWWHKEFLIKDTIAGKS